MDVNGDKIIDLTGSLAVNPGVFNINYSSPGNYPIKCIVSNYPSFPIAVGKNYEREYSNYPFSLDTNDNSCLYREDVHSFCGDGNKDP